MEFEATAIGGRGLEPDDTRPSSVSIDVPNPRAETSVEFAFTGGHALHLAVAGCVLNDVYREAQAMGIAIERVEVRAGGGFGRVRDVTAVVSTGIRYSVVIESPESEERVAELLDRVDEVAEIPWTLRLPTQVTRVEA